MFTGKKVFVRSVKRAQTLRNVLRKVITMRTEVNQFLQVLPVQGKHPRTGTEIKT